ncbi:hypothetical protein BGX28_003062 [Mortierella sp. GBA30]|nr:hypothetical protein BGX28_003062 [Mortierella sp. GBA30]
MPYNKFTLKKLVYKNVLPAWLQELEIQKADLIAKFKVRVRSDGVAHGLATEDTPQSSQGISTFTWTQGHRLLLWEIMEKYMEIRAGTKELHTVDSVQFPPHLSESQTRKLADDEIFKCFPQGWVSPGDISNQYMLLKEKISGQPASRRSSTDTQDGRTIEESTSMDATERLQDSRTIAESTFTEAANQSQDGRTIAELTSTEAAERLQDGRAIAESVSTKTSKRSRGGTPPAVAVAVAVILQEPQTVGLVGSPVPAVTAYSPPSPVESPEMAAAIPARDQPPTTLNALEKNTIHDDSTKQIDNQVEGQPKTDEDVQRGSGSCPQDPVIISDTSPIAQRPSFNTNPAVRPLPRRRFYSDYEEHEYEQHQSPWQQPRPEQQHQRVELPEEPQIHQWERGQMPLQEQIRQQDKLYQQIKEKRDKQLRLEREDRLRERLLSDKNIWEREQLNRIILQLEEGEKENESQKTNKQLQPSRIQVDLGVRDQEDSYRTEEQRASSKLQSEQTSNKDDDDADEEERRLLEEQEQRVLLQAQKLLEEQSRLQLLKQQKEHKKELQQQEQQQRREMELQLFREQVEMDKEETDRKHKEKQQQIKARWEKELQHQIRSMQEKRTQCTAYPPFPARQQKQREQKPKDPQQLSELPKNLQSRAGQQPSRAVARRSSGDDLSERPVMVALQPSQ